MPYQIVQQRMIIGTSKQFEFSANVKQWVAGVTGFSYVRNKREVGEGVPLKTMELKLSGNVDNSTITIRATGKLEYPAIYWHLGEDSYVDVTVVAWVGTEQDNVTLYAAPAIANGLSSAPVSIGSGVMNKMQAAIGGFSFDYGSGTNGYNTALIRAGSGCSRTGSYGYISSRIDACSDYGDWANQENNPATIDGILMTQITDMPGLAIGTIPGVSPGTGVMSVSLPSFPGRRIVNAAIMLQDFCFYQQVDRTYTQTRPIYSINLLATNIKMNPNELVFDYSMGMFYTDYKESHALDLKPPTNSTMIYVLVLENL